MSHRSLLVIATVLLFSFSARSQEATPLRGLDESAAAAVRKKAMDLLGSVAGQVDSLRSGENRARIGSNLGDLLWDRDEKRSRSLFAAVEEDIRTGFNDPDSDESARMHTVMVFWSLRSDTIGRIAKHDPELALEFLRATRLPAEVQLPPYIMNDTEQALELRLAGQISAKNPQLALKLGRQSLAQGFTTDLLALLSQLRKKDRETSLILYKEIVDKLKGTDLEKDWMGTSIAISLIQSFQPPEADEQVYRELIGVLVTFALANGCADAKEDDAPQICSEVGSVFPKIEKYYGQRGAPLKRWFEDGPESQSSEFWAQSGEVMEQGTVDEILALATKYPDMQAQIYWSAIVKARESGDLSRAREIASKYPDEDQRRNMLMGIDREQTWKSLNAEKLALVQQELSKLRNTEERIQFLFHVAIQTSGNDRKAALDLLSQAGQLIDSFKPGKTQLEAQIALAMMYCSLKSDRAFAIMEPLMPRLNEIVSAAATLDGFQTTYLRDGEWNMTGEGEVGRLLTFLAQNAGYFAAMDFDRSVTLASQLERPELRLMAQLKIAQGVLTNQPNAGSFFHPNSARFQPEFHWID